MCCNSEALGYLCIPFTNTSTDVTLSVLSTCAVSLVCARSLSMTLTLGALAATTALVSSVALVVLILVTPRSMSVRDLEMPLYAFQQVAVPMAMISLAKCYIPQLAGYQFTPLSILLWMACTVSRFTERPSPITIPF